MRRHVLLCTAVYAAADRIPRACALARGQTALPYPLSLSLTHDTVIAALAAQALR